MPSPVLTRRAALIAAGAAVAFAAQARRKVEGGEGMSDLILHGGRITTLDPARPEVSAIAVRDGRIVAAGPDREILAQRTSATRVVDLQGRRAIPGLNDSHTHPIRGGLNYNMELRWDGVASLATALRMLREQAQRTPAPQWVRVVGGWSELQFAEGRMPTLDEINAAAPHTPVFILHLYDRAWLNGAALRAVGYTKDTPDPPGGSIERDRRGNPTGLLIAKPNALILYATLAKGPKLGFDDQLNSTRQFLRELNRLGITSVIDAGGGFQNYPDDYRVVNHLARRDELTVRIAYNLFTQRPKEELADFEDWARLVKPGQGSDLLRMNGAGEMLVFSAADFEDFLEPRPELAASLETDLHDVVQLLARNRWPFRLHATYNESITRALDVFEAVNREAPLDGLHWFIDHAETIDARNIDRIRLLGGGIAIQHRMAYQGEYFRDRYGADKAAQSPPVRQMLAAGVPVGAGTDATRVASYNPWVSLYWLVAGRTVGGLQLYDERNRLDRTTALRLWTEGSAWFSTEDGKKGRLAAGQLGDVAVLSDDYFAVEDEAIKSLTSVLTIVGGRIVHADGPYKPLAPPLPPASPDWSPVRTYGGYQGLAAAPAAPAAALRSHRCAVDSRAGVQDIWGHAGCACFAF
ncbi:MAG TPA: amidohydrolase [Steroidobacteraceae bacterium]|nr:amidohydrolase [Steroidobacteraceae bacterium]